MSYARNKRALPWQQIFEENSCNWICVKITTRRLLTKGCLRYESKQDISDREVLGAVAMATTFYEKKANILLHIQCKYCPRSGNKTAKNNVKN